MSLVNAGIAMVDPKIKISGRFCGALKDLYDSPHQNVQSVTIKELEKYSNSVDGGERALEFFNRKSVFEEKFTFLYTTKALFNNLNKRLR